MLKLYVVDGVLTEVAKYIIKIGGPLLQPGRMYPAAPCTVASRPNIRAGRFSSTNCDVRIAVVLMQSEPPICRQRVS